MAGQRSFMLGLKRRRPSRRSVSSRRYPRFESLEQRRLLAVTLGDEFAVNSTTAGNQFLPQVATAADGQFVAVWDSIGQDGDGHGIVGRQFDRSGTATSDDFLVNTSVAGDQIFPSVDMSETGRTVVVWEGEDGDGRGVFGRIYDELGQPLGDEFLVNETILANQMLPHVSVDVDGDFLVVWNDVQINRDSQRIVARRFDAAGTPLTGDFQVNVSDRQVSFFGTAVIFGADEFAVAWERRDGLAGQPEIVARFFDSDGNGGDEVPVSDHPDSDNFFPAVATDHNGQVVFVWDRQQGDVHSVMARQFPDGASSALDEFQITDSPMFHSAFPAVAMDHEGNFVVVWDQFARDGDGQGSFGRMFDPQGGASGTVFQLNTVVADDQQRPAASISANDTFIAVWDSYGQDGDGHGVFGQRFGIEHPGGSISGYVYADVNNNGTMDSQEIGLPNVPIMLTGREDAAVTTNSDGYYRFDDVPPGLYTVTEIQPTAFLDGIDSTGTPVMGDVAANQFVGIEMQPSLDVTLYNFGERGLRPEFISKGQYLALSPSAGSLAADFTADPGRSIFTFDADTHGELTVDIDDAEGEHEVTVDLYSANMLPVALGGGGSHIAANVGDGESFVLYVAGLQPDQEVRVSVRLQPPPAPVGLMDVNRDGVISPLDALLIINYLNNMGNGRQVVAGTTTDVNGDGMVTPVDAMFVINHLKTSSAEGEAAISPQYVLPPADNQVAHRQFTTRDVKDRIADGLMDAADDVPLACLSVRWGLLSTTTQYRLIDAALADDDDLTDLADLLDVIVQQE